MDDRALVARFEDGSLPAEELRHPEHVRIAWIYLREAPFEEAAHRFCTNLRRYAAARGKSTLFHTTITWAYLALVSERIQAGPASADFDAFARANSDLFDHKNGALAAYYDKATLESASARAAFVLPRRREEPAPAT
jgi:hypothetical protein